MIKVAVGDSHAIFLLGNYQIMVCGSNQYGQLGLPKDEVPELLESPKISPVKFCDDTDLHISDIACGANHTLLLGKTAAGEKRLLVCGSEAGLGFGDLQDKFTPTLQPVAEGFDIDKIYASFNRSLAYNEQGKIYIWGEDFANDRVDHSKLFHDFQQKILSFAVGYLHGLAVTGNRSHRKRGR